MIDKIEIIRRSKVRRSKLYYIREKVAKEIRRQMRNMRRMDLSTGSDIVQKEEEKKEAEATEAKIKEEAEQEAVRKEASVETTKEELPQEKTEEETNKE